MCDRTSSDSLCEDLRKEMTLLLQTFTFFAGAPWVSIDRPTARHVTTVAVILLDRLIKHVMHKATAYANQTSVDQNAARVRPDFLMPPRDVCLVGATSLVLKKVFVTAKADLACVGQASRDPHVPSVQRGCSFLAISAPHATVTPLVHFLGVISAMVHANAKGSSPE